MKPLRAPPRRIRLQALAFYGAILVATVAFSVFVDDRLPTGDPSWARSGLALQVAAGVAAGLLVVAVSVWLDRSFDWSRQLSRRFRELLGGISAGDAFLLALSSSVAEEILFRGLILPHAGIVLSSLAFGLVHFVPERTWLPWSLLATGVGFVFGGLALATGSVLAPILAHFVVNYLNLLAMSGTIRFPFDGR
jgi:membrane protease YdiL (CAAX protease family)